LKRMRNVLRRLFRTGRGGASASDSIAPFIRIVKDQPCSCCGSKFPTRGRE